MAPGVQKTVLENGIRILTHRIPHVHSVSMGVWVNVGARDETPSENGLSHLIEHMIFKGTTKRSAFQIAKEFDAIGGQTNAFTSMENTCYHARVLDTHLDTMVDILSDIFLNSLFRESELEKERPVIFQEIGMVEDSPEEYVHVLSAGNYWGANPLGQSILGTRDNLRRFDAATVADFFQRLYQPNRILIAAAGNLEHDRFVEQVAPAFGSVKRGNGFPDRQTPAGRPRVAVHPKSIEQVHLCFTGPGFSITDSRRFAFSLLNTVLGGNMSSRLFQDIREQRGLAYAVYSFISAYEDTGIIGTYAGVAPDSASETVRLILKALRDIRRQPVAATELQDAREFTKGSLLLAIENVDSQMVRLAQNEIHYGRYVPLGEIVDQIDQVTPDEVLELAGHVFQPDRLALTVLGPGPDASELERLVTGA